MTEDTAAEQFVATAAYDRSIQSDPDAISVGDVVRLKSGGTWMTVENIHGARARCVWQPTTTSGSGLVLGTYRDEFPVAALEKRLIPLGD